MREPRARLAGMLGVAVGIHAVALFAISRLAPAVFRASTSPMPADALEVVLDPTLGSPDASRSAERGEPRAGVAAASSRSASFGRSTSASEQRPMLASRIEPATHALTRAAEPEPQGSSAPRKDGTQDSGDEGRPTLTLEQLGLGFDPSAFQRYSSNRPRKAPPKRDRNAEAQRRLQDSLRRDLADHDVGLGLGPQAPVLNLLETVARRSDAPGNSAALFAARIDAAGHLVSLELLEAPRSGMAWNAVGQRVRAQLAGQSLRVPPGARGVDLKIRVVSRIQLPSGASPGLGVSVLGIPVKKGQDERSAHIDVLKPHLSLDETEFQLPDGERVKMPVPRVGLTLLGVGGDPADIGAKPMRMVQAWVVDHSVY